MPPPGLAEHARVQAVEAAGLDQPKARRSRLLMVIRNGDSHSPWGSGRASPVWDRGGQHRVLGLDHRSAELLADPDRFGLALIEPGDLTVAKW